MFQQKDRRNNNHIKYLPLAEVIKVITELIGVNKKHFKMVEGCRIDTGPYKKALSKKDPPKTLGIRVSCRTGTGLDGQRARQA